MLFSISYKTLYIAFIYGSLVLLVFIVFFVKPLLRI